MKSRIKELEERRLALLARIETQRHEVAWRVEEFHPTSQVATWARQQGSRSAANHPLAWLAGIASILLMLKPRRILTWLPWVAGGLSLITRLTRVLRLINELRGFASRPR